jgi:crotonobetaine/carnitine-CoA ligase
VSTPTIPALLDLRADDGDSRPLLRVLDVERTAAELRDQAHGYGEILRGHGTMAGDRVALMADNCIELVETWLGCATIGAIFVPINTALRGPQLRHVLSDSEPTIVVTAGKYLPRIAEAGVPKAVRHLWTLDANSVATRGAEPLPPIGDSPSSDQGVRSPDCSALLYTSGTTGPSKDVECSHAHLYWWGRNTVAALGITPTDVLYTCLPLFHINALNTVIQSLFSGATAVVGPHFSASRFWARVAQAEATVTYLLGAMVSILASRQPTEYEPTHRLRVALAPATSPSIWKTFEERFGVQIVEGHGMTETNLALGPRDGEQRPGWMGRVMPGFEARVVDEQGNELPTNTPGELVLRPANREMFATAYWRQPEATATAWAGGWFHTGDRVLCDEDGYFRFVERLKDAIRRRGENISAWEVEQALESHPGVAAAAAVPVPSELGEDDVMAFVVLNDGATVDPAMLIRHCEGRLAYFAIPRYIEFLSTLPLTESGKVQKYVLRERGLSEITWDRERAGIHVRR